MQASHSYGVHEIEGQYYLFQSGTGEGLSVFGDGKRSPFTVQIKNRLAPPHNINLWPEPVDFAIPAGFLNNPIVDMFLPKPNFDFAPKMGCIKTTAFTIITDVKKLSQLSCPSGVSHIQLYRPEYNFGNWLDLTNLIPFVLMGIRTADTNGVNQIADCARMRHRKLLLIMDPWVPLPLGVEDYTENFEEAVKMLAHFTDQQLQQIGSNFFGKHMHILENSKWKSQEEPE